MKIIHCVTLAAALAGACVGLTASAAASVADGAGDADPALGNSLRLGVYSVYYNTRASDLSGPYVPAGVNFKADNLFTLYGAYVRRLSSMFDVELALGYPPISKVEGRGPATLGSVPYNGQVVSSARWLSPTLLLEYRFLEESSKWQPYFGVGVNYTAFYDRTSTAQGNAASGGPTRLSLTSSVGPAATLGMGYALTRRFHLYASYSVSKVATTIRAETGGETRIAHINFGPQALVVSGGYSF